MKKKANEILFETFCLNVKKKKSCKKVKPIVRDTLVAKIGLVPISKGQGPPGGNVEAPLLKTF